MGKPHWWLLFAVICLLWLQSCHSEDVLCKLSDLGQCHSDETCVQITLEDLVHGRCQCLSGKPRDASGSCSESRVVIPSTTPAPPPASNAAWGWLVAGFAAALLVAGLMLAARRFHWLAKLRARRQRTYDEVAFGQEDDDPPLA